MHGTPRPAGTGPSSSATTSVSAGNSRATRATRSATGTPVSCARAIVWASSILGSSDANRSTMASALISGAALAMPHKGCNSQCSNHGLAVVAHDGNDMIAFRQAALAQGLGQALDLIAQLLARQRDAFLARAQRFTAMLPGNASRPASAFSA